MNNSRFFTRATHETSSNKPTLLVETHKNMYHIPLYFAKGVRVWCGGVPLSKRKISALKIVHKCEPNTLEMKYLFLCKQTASKLK